MDTIVFYNMYNMNIVETARRYILSTDKHRDMVRRMACSSIACPLASSPRQFNLTSMVTWFHLRSWVKMLVQNVSYTNRHNTNQAAVPQWGSSAYCRRCQHPQNNDTAKQQLRGLIATVVTEHRNHQPQPSDVFHTGNLSRSPSLPSFLFSGPRSPYFLTFTFTSFCSTTGSTSAPTTRAVRT
jgi:hypothetical protein